MVGTTTPVFVGITLVLMGFAAWMTGQAMANAWKPMWHVLPFGLLLGFADRFLIWGLFHPDDADVLWLVSGYAIDTAILLAYALVAFRLTKARKMVAQYPWIYERTGPFGWREKVPLETGDGEKRH